MNKYNHSILEEQPFEQYEDANDQNELPSGNNN
jgi:hypothetical protein